MSYENYKIILDSPSVFPVLGFQEYANALTQIIEKSDPRFAIGIYGTWGTGKTTLMENIIEKLNKDVAIPIRFNAWRYQKEDHLIVPFLDALQDQLVTWSIKRAEQDRVDKVASSIRKVIKSLVAGSTLKISLPGVVDWSINGKKVLGQENDTKKGSEIRSLYYSCFQALKKSFNDLISTFPNNRIVIFIDDLDRCLPESALEIMEAMKLFFDMKGFIFVVGLDFEVITKIIDQKYLQKDSTDKFQIRGRDYIKKIFQVPFTLQPVSFNQIEEYLVAICNDYGLPDEQISDIKQTISPHLEALVAETNVNPREIKRYINAYTLQMKIKGFLDPNIVLTILTISFRREWDIVKNALITFRGIFTDAIIAHQNGNPNNLSNLIKNLHPGKIPQDFLDYVEKDEPGYALLKQDINFDEYLYSGGSSQTESSFDYWHIEGIRGLVESLQILETIKESKERTSENSLMDLREKIQLLYKSESELESDYRRDIEYVERKLAMIPENPERVIEWKKETEDIIRRLLKRISSRY